MRFLVDECLPHVVVEILENHGFDVLDIANSRHREAKDTELVEIAIKESRIILTKNLGYSIITLQKSLQVSGYSGFRVFFRAKSIGLLLKEFLEKIDFRDMASKLVILSPGKIRIKSVS